MTMYDKIHYKKKKKKPYDKSSLTENWNSWTLHYIWKQFVGLDVLI